MREFHPSRNQLLALLGTGHSDELHLPWWPERIHNLSCALLGALRLRELVPEAAAWEERRGCSGVAQWRNRFAAVCGCIVAWGAPLAAGSGIPEIKTYLNGVRIPGEYRILEL